MGTQLKHRIVYKILLLITLIVLVFSVLSIYLTLNYNQTIIQTLKADQETYISNRLKAEKGIQLNRELFFMRSHAKDIVQIINAALLYNVDKAIIRDAVNIYLKQASIRSIYIYDGITKQTYLSLAKIHGRIQALSKDLNSTIYDHLSFPLQISGNEFGRIKIYYDLKPIRHRIQEEILAKKNVEINKLYNRTTLLRQKLSHHLKNLTVVSLLYVLAILMVIWFIIVHYVNKPLATLQNNLNHFFAFLEDKNRSYTPSVIHTEDEFGHMCREINIHIETALDMHNEIELTQKEILQTIGTIAEEHSKETSMHVQRVAQYSEILATHYGLDVHDVRLIREASPLHDIGKLSTPDSILHKAGKLTPEEFTLIQQHTIVGYTMLKNSKRPLVQAAAIIAHQHHEKYDGSGYPRGLKEEEIHIYGRIVALADVFDALGSDRIYKKAWEDQKIFALFHSERGKHFDPTLIDIFFEHLEEFLAARKALQDTV